MAIEHVDITDPDIHDIKDVASASDGQVPVCVSGASVWRYCPHSFLYYDDLGGSGTTISTPTTYTLINPTTTGDTDPKEFTHNSAGRLTYTGTSTMDFSINISLSIKHSSASAVDIYFQLHKNGGAVTGAQQVTSAASGNYENVGLNFHLSLAQNDYIELYCKTASGSVVIWAMNMFVKGDF